MSEQKARNEFYPCKDSIFRETYEPAAAPPREDGEGDAHKTPEWWPSEQAKQAELEGACRFAIALGYATGHADTFDDLVAHVREQRDEYWPAGARRKLEAKAVAAEALQEHHDETVRQLRKTENERDDAYNLLVKAGWVPHWGLKHAEEVIEKLISQPPDSAPKRINPTDPYGLPLGDPASDTDLTPDESDMLDKAKHAAGLRVAHGLLGDAGYSLRGDEDYDELLAVLKGADTLTGSSDNRDVQQVKYPIHLSRELRVERTVYSSGEGTNSYEYHVVDEDGATVAPHCESDNAEMALIETVEGLAGNRDYWKERAESAERLLQRETEQHDRERIFDDEQREILRRACAYPASDTEGSADEIEGMIESLPAAYKGRILKEIDDLRDRCEAAEHNLENWTREFGTSVLRVRTDLNEAHELAAHYRRDLDFAYAAERAMKERCASIAAEERKPLVDAAEDALTVCASCAHERWYQRLWEAVRGERVAGAASRRDRDQMDAADEEGAQR